MYSTDYKLLAEQAESLISGIPYPTANLANLSALLFQTMEGLNWAGFYIADGDKLILGPFQGKTACIVIPFGKGVCGTAAAMDKAQLVPDVHEFPGHIACDSDSNSEIVIPIHVNGKVYGVLDIDSPLLSRFTEEDKNGLENVVRILENALERA